MSLAAEQAHWLTLRAELISRNISNADTPGFEAKDVRPFQNYIESQSIQLATTHAGHIPLDETDINTSNFVQSHNNDNEKSISGNSVNIEKELENMGEVNRMYSLNTSIVKSFNRMFMAAIKS